MTRSPKTRPLMLGNAGMDDRALNRNGGNMPSENNFYNHTRHEKLPSLNNEGLLPFIIHPTSQGCFRIAGTQIEASELRNHAKLNEAPEGCAWVFECDARGTFMRLMIAVSQYLYSNSQCPWKPSQFMSPESKFRFAPNSPSETKMRGARKVRGSFAPSPVRAPKS